jgi:hypothetical protein
LLDPPSGDALHEFLRQRSIMGDLNGAFGRLEGCEFIGEGHDGCGAWVHADMVFESTQMNQVRSLVPSGEAVGNTFHGVRGRSPDDLRQDAEP